MALLTLALATARAMAAVTCTVTVTSITSVYDPTSATANVTTGSYTINCTRALADPNTFAWQLGVNDGLHAAAGSNRVQVGGGQRYNYDTYRTSPYTSGNLWGDTATTRFTGTLSFGASLTASTSAPFDVVLPGSQTVQPTGTYTDTVTATLRNGAGTSIATTTFSVNVITSNTCQISVPPGNVNITYTSSQASAATGSTSFGVRCTTGLPYTMALDATLGTLLGLTYTLALSASSASGTGATQTCTVNGSIAGNQAGTCSTGVCTGSQTRTLTLSW